MVDVLAAERRHVVAMGASPWIVGDERELSPNGTTRIDGRQGPVTPLGLGGTGASVVTTGSRPWLQHAVPSGLMRGLLTPYPLPLTPYP